jgi:hypothetical protein
MGSERAFPVERHGRNLSGGRAALRRAVGIDLTESPVAR